MVRMSPAARRLLVTMLGAIVLIAACSGSVAAPSAAPSQAAAATAASSPTPRPTPRPTPLPTPKPTPTASPDPAAALKIAAPYKLRDNPANKALTANLELTVAGIKVTEIITGREIVTGGKVVGMVLVLQIVGIPMNTAAFNAGAEGAARNVGGTATYTTISGLRVAMIKAPSGQIGMVLLHDNILMVIGTKPADTKPLLTQIIKANK
jgi:hypothetical protein